MRLALLFFGIGSAATSIPILYHSVNGNPEAVRWIATIGLLVGISLFSLGIVISKKRTR